MTNGTNVQPISERTIPVHKTDHEGVIHVNAYTGIITTPNDERPEWADGLSTALIVERHGWYSSRLGQQYGDEHKHPAAFNFADLGWIGLDDEGEPVELDADVEFRMEVLAGVAGIDREEGILETGTGRFKNLAEVEIAMDRERTGEEIAAMETAQDQGFQEVRKDGTND